MAKKKLVPPVKCPKCGSDDLSKSDYYRDLYAMSEEVVCDSCGHSWIERYTLILEEIEECDDGPG